MSAYGRRVISRARNNQAAFRVKADIRWLATLARSVENDLMATLIIVSAQCGPVPKCS